MIHVRQIKYYIHARKKTVERLDNPEINYCDLTFVHEGQFDYQINGSAFSVGAGEGMFCPCGGRRSRSERSEPALYTSINFTISPESVIDLPYHIRSAASMPIKFYLGQLSQAYYSNQPNREDSCQHILTLILYQLADLNQHDASSSHVEAIKSFISGHFSRGIRLADIAAEVSLNSSYCSTLFKQQEGVSISEYLTAIRISHAQGMLRYDDFSITEIAAQAGFCDVFYFSRVFRKCCGQTPTAFRKSLRDGLG